MRRPPATLALVRTLPFSLELYQYLIQHGTPPDEVLDDLSAETQSLGGVSRMQIPPDQGAFMMLLTKLISPKLAIEIGTFTGYSAIWIARGLPADGRLICMDINREWTDIARRYWARAGLESKITLKLGAALETLGELSDDTPVDLAFIDADKLSYADYYEALVPRLSQRGAILVDNVLWSGQVVDANDTEADTLALREFNRHVADDPRTEQVVLPIGDGVSLITLA